jgi:hypothetical protein
MAILCCVAQKAASAAQTLFIFKKMEHVESNLQKCLVIWPEFCFVHVYFSKKATISHQSNIILSSRSKAVL